MKKLVKIAICAIALAAIMFAEYRYIMVNIHPYRGEGDTIYLEVFGQVDAYSIEE